MTDPLHAVAFIGGGLLLGLYLGHRHGGEPAPYDRPARYACDACPGETFTDWADAEAHALTHDAIDRYTADAVISEL